VRGPVLRDARDMLREDASLTEVDIYSWNPRKPNHPDVVLWWTSPDGVLCGAVKIATVSRE